MSKPKQAPLYPAQKPCRCGSGLERRELRDAHGIFCTFVCDACEAEKRAGFNPAIFVRSTYPSDEPLDSD